MYLEVLLQSVSSKVFVLREAGVADFAVELQRRVFLQNVVLEKLLGDAFATITAGNKRVPRH